MPCGFLPCGLPTRVFLVGFRLLRCRRRTGGGGGCLRDAEPSEHLLDKPKRVKSIGAGGLAFHTDPPLMMLRAYYDIICYTIRVGLTDFWYASAKASCVSATRVGDDLIISKALYAKKDTKRPCAAKKFLLLLQTPTTCAIMSKGLTAYSTQCVGIKEDLL